MKQNELKAARVRLGVTQEDCAKVLGITKVAYSQKERGVGNFSLEQAGALRGYLQLKDADFLNIFFADNVYTNDNKAV